MSRYMRNIVSMLIPIVFVAVLSASVYASESFSILKLEQRGSNYIFLEWDAYPEADGYSLYRCEENKAFTLIKNILSCNTYNYSLENGKTYTYMVRPYKMLSDGRKQYVDESTHASIQIGVKRPENLEVRPCGKTSATISWVGDPLAEYYFVYRSSDSINWTLIKRVYDETTTTYGLEEGKCYSFRVKAVRKIDGVVRYSDDSDPVECTLGIAAPRCLNIAHINSNSVELEWEAVQGATGYRIYRAEDDGAYELVKTVTGTTTKNYNLSSDVTYTYRIAAIMETDTCTFKSVYTYAQPIRLSLGVVENLHVDEYLPGGVRLYWDPVPGATGYRLYRTGEDGITRLVKTISDHHTSTYSLEAGQCYRFEVKPICTSGAVTINGPLSEELPVFFASAPRLTVVQCEVNQIHLSWNAVKGAEKYMLTVSGEGAVFETELSETETEYEISQSGEIHILVHAVRGGIAIHGAAADISPVYEPVLSFDIAQAINEKTISLAWKGAEHALQYEVQRFDPEIGAFVAIGVCVGTSFVDNDVLADTEYRYRYRVQYNNDDNAFWGNWSETVRVRTPGTPKYRALLIGEENYDSVLNGPVNDVEAMANMLLGMKSMDWETYRQTDATRDEIVSLISLAFMDATENDVSLFYYSGHGVTGSGDYYSGALMTVDYNYITMEELAELLSAVPGKVIVVLDSCGSGAAIGSGEDALSTLVEEQNGEFSPMSFNTQVIQVFSRYNKMIQDKAGDLATDKFYVLASSAYEQNSRSICIDNVWGGVFTRAFVGSVGYDYNSKSWGKAMNADRDADDCITIVECYEYCVGEISRFQDVQAYPLDSSVRLFYR